MNFYSDAFKVAIQQAMNPEEDRLANSSSCLVRAVSSTLVGSTVECDSSPRISLQKRKSLLVDEQVSTKFRRTCSSNDSLWAWSLQDFGICEDAANASDSDELIMNSLANDKLLNSCASLELQLKFVAPDDVFGTCETAPFLLFPNLPVAISTTSSCPTADGALNETTTVVSDDSNSERYGWFVEMDSNETEVCESRTYNATLECLAFSASTAPVPRGGDDEAELQWAQAADTVDHVLEHLF